MSYRRARAGGFGQQIELLQLIVTDRRQGLVEIVLGPGFPPNRPRRKRQLVDEHTQAGEPIMRSIVLWAIGIPIPIILLLAFCTHHL